MCYTSAWSVAGSLGSAIGRLSWPASIRSFPLSTPPKLTLAAHGSSTCPGLLPMSSSLQLRCRTSLPATFRPLGLNGFSPPTLPSPGGLLCKAPPAKRSLRSCGVPPLRLLALLVFCRGRPSKARLRSALLPAASTTSSSGGPLKGSASTSGLWDGPRGPASTPRSPSSTILALFGCSSGFLSWSKPGAWTPSAYAFPSRPSRPTARAAAHTAPLLAEGPLERRPWRTATLHSALASSTCVFGTESLRLSCTRGPRWCLGSRLGRTFVRGGKFSLTGSPSAALAEAPFSCQLVSLLLRTWLRTGVVTPLCCPLSPRSARRSGLKLRPPLTSPSAFAPRPLLVVASTPRASRPPLSMTSRCPQSGLPGVPGVGLVRCT